MYRRKYPIGKGRIEREYDGYKLADYVAQCASLIRNKYGRYEFFNSAHPRNPILVVIRNRKKYVPNRRKEPIFPNF